MIKRVVEEGKTRDQFFGQKSHPKIGDYGEGVGEGVESADQVGSKLGKNC